MSLEKEIQLMQKFITRAEHEARVQGRTEALEFVSLLIERWKKLAKEYLESPHSYSPVDIGEAYSDCAEMLEDQIEKFAGC